MKIRAALLSLLIVVSSTPTWAEDEIVTGPDRRDEIDLQELDFRIGVLDARIAEISTHGPKVFTFVGLGTATLGAIIFGPAFSNAIACDQGCDEGYDAAWARVWPGVALLGVGITTAAISGSIWGARAHRRNEIGAERESLIEKRDGLAASLSRLELRSPYRNGTQFVTLGVRF